MQNISLQKFIILLHILYVRPHNLDGEIYAEDLNVSKELVRDYIEIIQSRPVLENAIANLELQKL